MIRMSGMLVALTFGGLSLFHVYWALGGRFGSGVTVPTVGNSRAFHPSPLGTVLVATGLLLAMLTVLGRLGLLGEVIPRWVFRWGTGGIALIFFLRAVGEFRLVGFFKRASDTSFAYWDTWLFSPLCLSIAVIAFTLVYFEA
ncbi:MAG: DUF3995 domain-containing protein [Pyrinomonadaceae bacterium]